MVHFQRYESVVEAIKSFRLPPQINFIGFSANGEAFNGMYPWITALIFIIPHVFLANPITSLYIGFSLLIFLDLINSYFLLQLFTGKKIILITGSVVYAFNQYNLINMYNRGALGEALAFAFLPLALMGLILIWRKSNLKGILILSIGMSLVLNSHILSTAIVVIYFSLFELYRILTHRFSFNELKSILISAILTLLMSIYTVYNIVSLTLSNSLTSPWRALKTIDLGKFLDASLKASLNVGTNNFNIGIFPMLLLVALGVCLFMIANNGYWKKWIIISWITFLLTLSWIPYTYLHLDKTFLGTIQFTSRLFNFVILFMVVGLVIFLNNFKQFAVNRFGIALSVITCLFACSTEINYINNKNYSYNVTSTSYNEYVHGGNYAENDYSKKMKNGESVIYKAKLMPSRNNLQEWYNGVEFEVYSPKNYINEPIRFLTYKGIKYKVWLNNRKYNADFDKGLLYLKLKKGNNLVRIISSAPVVDYFVFILQILSMLMAFIVLVRINYKNVVKQY